jgi:sugar phosphate isomerase/epimerase
MDFALSSHLFANDRLNSHVLDQILAVGIHRMEIFAARQHLDYHDSNQVRDVAQWFADHNVALHSVHAPMFSDMNWGRLGGFAVSVASLERRLRIDSTDEIKRALEIAERLPFRYLVVHLGLEEEEYDLRKFDAAFSSLEHLNIFAKDRGVQILLENIPSDLSTPARLVEFIQYTRLDVRVCFDTGHAHLAGGVGPAFETLKQYIASTHVHDNRQDKDDHLMPYDGSIDWHETIRCFRTANPQFPILFELKDYGPESTNLTRLAQVMDKMEKSGDRS